MDITPQQQVEQIARIFGNQVELAVALGLRKQTVSEWKRLAGIPPAHWRRIAVIARDRALDLPGWFPRFADIDDGPENEAA